MLDIGEPSSAQPGADQASHFGRSYGALGPIARRGNDILLTVVEAPFAELVRLSPTTIADEMREEHRRRVLGQSSTDQGGGKRALSLLRIGLFGLDRRTWDRTVRTEHTTIARFWF